MNPNNERPDLDRLLEMARAHVVTPREIWLQRVSFVYGQLMDANPGVTRQEIEERAARIYGPCPNE